MFNLAVILENSARAYPDKEAVTFNHFRLTFKMIDDLANQVANGLRAAGIRKGDKVAFSCPNIPYFPIVYFGILKAGAVFVPLNVLLREREVAYHLSDSDSVAFICFEGREELPIGKIGYAGFQEAQSCDHFWIIPTIPGGDSPIEGVPTLADLMHDQPTTCDTVQCRADDTCIIIYTSGTTGRPKGAELTHSNILMNCMSTRRLIKGGPDDVALAVLPLFHSFGLTGLLNSAVLNGSRLVLVPRFEPAEVLRAFQEENVTLFAGVPTMYWELLHFADLDKYDLKRIAENWRLGVSGGAAMPVDLMKQFQERFQIRILEGYGLSETSPTASFSREDMPQKIGSIGVPIWGVEMMIVDPDMNEVPLGETGEIVIRGHNVMKGYYKHDEANEEAFRGGWFHTGDIGYQDEDGYFFIVDRIKDMIIRGGFNVYPREIEEVLMMHPDITLAAVIGVPNEEHGEEIKAFVIPRKGSSLTVDEVISFSKKEMAGYKYPRIVELCENLPIGPTGKVLKTELRKKQNTVANV
ncbi:MAG: long-chain fatty acid--CoA ligase [Candidatus Hydrogenedentes bacterium]|nr:long-chain fatty acid--CoA ligase [Candidatus Hydrogenedentota bacterium]